jgi:hypothetical protein
MVKYPMLNREAARLDPTAIDEWQRSVPSAYRELTATGASFSPSEGGQANEQLAGFERRALEDRDWVEGYRRGLADAGVPVRQGPGATRGGLRDDGWSASPIQLQGYKAGLEDGGA